MRFGEPLTRHYQVTTWICQCVVSISCYGLRTDILLFSFCSIDCRGDHTEETDHWAAYIVRNNLQPIPVCMWQLPNTVEFLFRSDSEYKCHINANLCVCTIQISYMSCSEMELLDSSLVGPVLVLVNQYFSIIDDYPALWFCFVSAHLIIIFS